ncbi:MAG: hypothetical protein E4G91_02465 [Candidatus Zixiibacteriota bacterium]|nr:MAG: hypothetical protein E4G91_02465 [candidate division Zixibacteria bacterium]
MRKLILFFLVLNASLWAQAVVPQTAKDTLDLTPRCKRGDAQVYRLALETVTLDDEGKPAGVKRNRIDYMQLCLANSPDSGLIYEITVDSFSIGSPQAVGEEPRDSRSIVDSLM